MGLVIALLFGAAIGGGMRLSLPRLMPRRFDVSIVLAAVGGGLAVLAGTVVGRPWSARPSTGSVLAAAAGAVAILIAYLALPRAAPSLVRSLPGREPAGGR